MASNRDGHSLYFLLFAAAISMLADVGTAVKPAPVTTLSRKDFPADFMFGAASAAYQVEGAANEGGRGPSIWDRFVHAHPEKILGRSNADKSIDMYHHYKEDIGHMKETGLEAFRFSISWPRILPNGTISTGINKEGVQYYNNFINELLAKGIEPLATIYHWDIPAALDDEYGGFLSPRIVEGLQELRGSPLQRVRRSELENWITFNEHDSFCRPNEIRKPGRISPAVAPNGRVARPLDDAGREAYLAGHSLVAGPCSCC
ncbi:uncharacterized protein A4U43_C08F17100 [Asparagus officinalis]|nr:uncharacterized protein A4U43_C08F17100 [Asparagus officinalis]